MEEELGKRAEGSKSTFFVIFVMRSPCLVYACKDYSEHVQNTSADLEGNLLVELLYMYLLLGTLFSTYMYFTSAWHILVKLLLSQVL